MGAFQTAHAARHGPGAARMRRRRARRVRHGGGRRLHLARVRARTLLYASAKGGHGWPAGSTAITPAPGHEVERP